MKIRLLEFNFEHGGGAKLGSFAGSAKGQVQKKT